MWSSPACEPGLWARCRFVADVVNCLCQPYSSCTARFIRRRHVGPKKPREIVSEEGVKLLDRLGDLAGTLVDTLHL